MVPERYEMLFLVAGIGLFASPAAFFASLVYGPLSFPRGSLEAFLSKGLLAFLALGLAVNVIGLAQKLLA